MDSQLPTLFRGDSLCYDNFLMLKLSLVWPVGVHPSWSPCPFDISALLFELCLAFWHGKICVRLYNLVLFLFQLWNQLFLQGVLVSLSGTWYLEVNI